MNEKNKALLKSMFPKVSFNRKVENAFLSSWFEQKYSKGEYILEDGQHENYFRYVLDGIQVLFCLKDGKEIVLGFYSMGHICSNFRSYISKRNSQLNIKAITPTHTLNISIRDYEKLFEVHSGFSHWNKACYDEYMLYSFDRELDLLTLSAQERYNKFIATCPEIYRQIPQKYLASYLTMTQETFSRMRAIKN